ncbi:T9SS type A sorting domain-containing protein, partial [Flavobacterium pedocola]
TVVTWTFADGNGNTSTATQNVILNNTTDTTVTVSGGTLTANATADSYQWIDCNNGNAFVPGANGQSFTPSVDGNYAVILTVGGCEATSVCNTVLGVKDDVWAGISLYPNPTMGNFTIRLPYSFDKAEVIITDLLGKTIKQINFAQQEELHLSLDGVANGVYFVRIDSETKSKTFKVIKK